MQGIEPTTRLIYSLGDKICRILNMRWILGEWHCSRIEPYVHHLFHSSILFASFYQHRFVYIWSMQIKFIFSIMWKWHKVKFAKISILHIIKVRIICLADHLIHLLKKKILTPS